MTMFQRFSKIQSCYLGPDISPENFISEHFFLFLLKGKIDGFDGHKKHFLETGEACLITKNSLARYSKYPEDGDFKKVVVIFDTPFLKNYQAQHAIKAQTPVTVGTPVARCPPHRSVRALLTHTAPTSSI